MTERQKIQQAILVLAETMGKQLSPAALKLFTDALGAVTAKQVEESILQHMRGPNGRFWPSPGDLLTHIHRYQSVPQAANECVSRVLEAVSRFGYVDPKGAREFLGEAVWSALPGEIGWRDFCTSGEHVSQSTARAQLRDRIAAQLQKEFPTGQVALPPPGKPLFQTLLIESQPLDAPPTESARESAPVSISSFSNVIKNGGTDGNQVKK